MKFLAGIKARRTDSDEEELSSKSDQPISTSTKAYLEKELKEILNNFSQHIKTNLSEVNNNQAAYKLVIEEITKNINAIVDVGFNQNDRNLFINIIDLLNKNISKLIEAQQNIIDIERANITQIDKKNQKDKNEKTIKVVIEQLGNIPTEVQAAIRSIVERKAFAVDLVMNDSIFDQMLKAAQSEVDESLYEKGDFNLEVDSKRFDPQSIKMLTKKIEKLDFYLCKQALERSLEENNTPLAYELTKKLIVISSEEDKAESLYKNLFRKCLGTIFISNIAQDDPRILFFNHNYIKIINNIHDYNLLEEAKTTVTENNGKPSYLLNAIKARLDNIPQEYHLFKNSVKDKINMSDLSVQQVKEKCLEILSLQKDLRENYNQELSNKNFAKNIYLLYFAKEKEMVSKNQLEIEANKLLEKDEEIKSALFSEEKIKEKIINNLRELGIIERELSPDILFKELKQNMVLESASVDENAYVPSRGSDTYTIPTTTTKNNMAFDKSKKNQYGGVQLKTVAGGNKWHIAASSASPEDALKEVNIGIDQIAVNDRADNSIHSLFKNQKSSIEGIKNAAEFIFKKYLESQGAAELTNLLNARNTDENTALHLLCKNPKIKNEELVELLVLLKRNGADLSAKDKDGQTALHILCSRAESFEAVQYLSNIIDVNIQDNQGFSPLYRALQYHQTHIVSHLIEKGADKNLKQTGNSQFPLTAQEYIDSIAPYGASKGLTEDLEARKSLFNRLEKNIEEGNIESLKDEILNNKSIVQERDGDGNSLLHIAVLNDKQDIIKLLLNNDCGAFLSNNNNQTPIDIALSKETVALLLENGESIKAYREEHAAKLKNKDKSYIAGASAAIATGLFGTLATNVPKDIGSSIVAAGAVLSAAAISGAAIWGAGRLGYECWHQYKEGADANISDAYFLPSNFTKSWKELQELETSSDINSLGIDCLKDLEEKIVAETKKQSPDVVLMGENLLKADLLRKILFKEIEDKAQLLAKSEELINHFNKWKEVQEGRELSEGLKLFYGAVTNLSVAAAVGAAASLVTDNLPVIAASAVIGGGAKWVNKVKSSTKNEERKV